MQAAQASAARGHSVFPNTQFITSFQYKVLIFSHKMFWGLVLGFFSKGAEDVMGDHSFFFFFFFLVVLHFKHSGFSHLK